jgi:UDP-N-acetylmuramoylalanine-D-glutamate ligase
MCSNLASFSIPKTVIEIGEGAFHNTKFYKTESNWVNGSLIKDDCLIDIKKSLADEMDTYVVPDGVRVIAAYMFPNFENVVICKKFHEAVKQACSITKEGSTVLLSPGCSSLDEFNNYKERGDVFTRIVKEYNNVKK